MPTDCFGVAQGLPLGCSEVVPVSPDTRPGILDFLTESRRPAMGDRMILMISGFFVSTLFSVESYISFINLNKRKIRARAARARLHILLLLGMVAHMF